MDYYKSHLSEEFITTAHNSKIHFIMIPPHSSHLLQPLDVGCFSHLKREYKRVVRDKLSMTMDPIRRAEFNQIYQKARPKAFTKPRIQKAFSISALYPPNRKRIKETEQLRNYTQTRPEYVPPSTSKHSDPLRTP